MSNDNLRTLATFLMTCYALMRETNGIVIDLYDEVLAEADGELAAVLSGTAAGYCGEIGLQGSRFCDPKAMLDMHTFDLNEMELTRLRSLFDLYTGNFGDVDAQILLRALRRA